MPDRLGIIPAKHPIPASINRYQQSEQVPVTVPVYQQVYQQVYKISAIVPAGMAAYQQAYQISAIVPAGLQMPVIVPAPSQAFR